MKRIIAIIVLFIMLFQFNFATSSSMDKHNCMREWWNIDAFFEMAGKNYSITSSFEYEMETPAANLFLTLFNHDDGSYYDLGSYEDNIDVLEYENGKIKYKNSWLEEKYPIYRAFFDRDNVKIYIELEALSPVKRVAEEMSSSLPVGLGSYIYTFVGKCRANGWIYMNGINETFSGIAYFEHVWGNWSYNSPMHVINASIIKDYFKLYRWWKNDMRLNFNPLLISNDNPFGYDWSWSYFNNGWTMFFGNIPFWINNIPMGIIYLYDGNTYRLLKVTECRYVNGVYMNGAFFARELHIRAEGDGVLNLTMEMTQDAHVYMDKLSSRYWRYLTLYECPGNIDGYYEKNGEIIELKGRGEIEIERQSSLFDYNLINITMMGKYPLGVQLIIISYLFHFKVEAQIYLMPLTFNFSFSKIGDNQTQPYGCNNKGYGRFLGHTCAKINIEGISKR
ncbi:MAG: hypothetical protein J7K61_02245 [Thermoplasmata archaeon]|nr:hypothetical protein [Thermoplasmata archaeon]